MHRTAFFLTLSLLFAPVSAFAQDHDPGEAGAEHAEDGAEAHGHVHLSDVLTDVTFLSSVVNFALLMLVFYKLGNKPIREFLAARRKSVEEGLAEAARLSKEAEAKHKQYSERLEQLDREIEEIRAEMIKAGEAERDRIVSEAEAKAARMRRETDFLIEQQMKQIRVDLRREAVEAAVSAAEAALLEKTTPADLARLGQSYLERLQEKAQKEERA